MISTKSIRSFYVLIKDREEKNRVRYIPIYTFKGKDVSLYEVFGKIKAVLHDSGKTSFDRIKKEESDYQITVVNTTDGKSKSISLYDSKLNIKELVELVKEGIFGGEVNG